MIPEDEILTDLCTPGLESLMPNPGFHWRITCCSGDVLNPARCEAISGSPFVHGAVEMRGSDSRTPLCRGGVEVGHLIRDVPSVSLRWTAVEKPISLTTVST